MKNEFTVSSGAVRRRFWGVSCVGGKAYQQVVNSTFHLTMAVLDPKSYDSEVRDKTVTLNVVQDGQVFLLCVLKHGQIQQVNLNLIFGKGDDVQFTIGGYGTVHLTGYTIIDSSDEIQYVDNQHFCPVSEVGSEKEIFKRLPPPENGVEIKTKKKAYSKLLKAYLGEIGDDDEDDSDFSLSGEEVEEESDDDDEDDDSEDIEIDEEELNDVMRERDELETPPKSEGSNKRKIGSISLSEKRIRRDNDEKDEITLENNESGSDEGGMNSSIGNTPMPKKLDDSAKQKKKLKKKKRLSDISNLDKSIKMDDSSEPPSDKSTPRKKGGKTIHPVVKLEGGVEYQDVIVGRGPVAATGKVAAVFYVGRLENKTIFDARTAPKKPFTFKVGVPEVIKGLDLGIQGMKVGGQRKLKIPPMLGYGSKGVTGVPPNSTLYFTVELQSVGP